MVRRVPPDIILMRSPPDYHPDDRTTSQTLWDICAMTTVPNIETEAVPCEVIPEIYHFDTLAGIDSLLSSHITNGLVIPVGVILGQSV